MKFLYIEQELLQQTLFWFRLVRVRYDASQTEDNSGSATTPEEEQMSAEMMQAFGISIITKISGGEIISSNAGRVEGGTAIWETPALVEVTLTEAADLNSDVLALENPSTGNFDLTALINAANELEATDNPVSAEALSAPQTPSEDTATTGSDTAQNADSATETTAESPATTTETTSENTTPSTDAATQTTETDATTPAGEDQALPSSGAVLPESNSAMPFILGGLLLTVLVGAGTIASVQHKK